MVLVQKWPFFQLFFSANIGQENVFYDILERKNAFQGYKNNKLKKSKNKPFSKWVTSWFSSQTSHFFNFYFQAIQATKNHFYDILERKNAFLSCKNKKFKKSKNCHFSKGVNTSFSSNNGLFQNFFFSQYRPGKYLIRSSRTKKCLCRL